MTLFDTTGSSNAAPNNNPKKMPRYPQPQVIIPQMPNVPPPHHNNGSPAPGMSSIGPPNATGMNAEDESSSESAGKDDVSKVSKIRANISFRLLSDIWSTRTNDSFDYRIRRRDRC